MDGKEGGKDGSVSVLVREIEASDARPRLIRALRMIYGIRRPMRCITCGTAVIIGRCRLAATIAILGSVYCDGLNCPLIVIPRDENVSDCG